MNWWLRVRLKIGAAFHSRMGTPIRQAVPSTSNQLQAIPKLRLRLPLKFHKSQSTMVWPGMATG